MKKYHLYLSEEERQLVVHALIGFRNRLIAGGRYTDCVDELLMKVMYAKTKKVKIRSRRERQWKNPSLKKWAVHMNSGETLFSPALSYQPKKNSP